jgi:hypothetical protein
MSYLIGGRGARSLQTYPKSPGRPDEIVGFDIAVWPGAGGGTDSSYDLIVGSNFMWPRDINENPLLIGPYSTREGDGIYMQYDVGGIMIGLGGGAPVGGARPAMHFAPAIQRVDTGEWFMLNPFRDAIINEIPQGSNAGILRATEGALFIPPPGEYNVGLYCIQITRDDMPEPIVMVFGPDGLGRPRIFGNHVSREAILQAFVLQPADMIPVTPGAVPYAP